MKIRGVAAMAAMAWTGASANAVPAAETQVVVCMTPTDDMGLQSQAKKVASVILASIGVKIQWHGPGKCPAEAILITLSTDTPATLLPGARRGVLRSGEERPGEEPAWHGIVHTRARDRPRDHAHPARRGVALRERHHEGAMDPRRLSGYALEPAPVHR